MVDLECPACRVFQENLEHLLTQRGNDVRVLYLPFPLEYHRFALPGANAAECAAEAGRLREWVRTVYEKQDSLGLLTWGTLALRAGFADTVMISRCARQPEPAPRIARGLALGDAIDLRGTPTVIINGWRYPGTPTKEKLAQAVEAALRGDDPS